MLSIVVTTYNKPHFLINALNGCMAQDIEKEIVVINDNGAELPEQVRDFVADHKIQYEYLAANRGLSGARNYGIAKTRGDWVVVVDEDDWPYTNAFQGLLVWAGNADIVYGQMMTTHHAFPAPDVTRHNFLTGNPLFVTSPYRRKVWEKLKGYKIAGKSFYEDWNFWLRAYRAGFKFRYVPIPVYRRFERPDSMCRDIEPYRNEAVEMTLIDGFTKKEIYAKYPPKVQDRNPRYSDGAIHPLRGAVVSVD